MDPLLFPILGVIIGVLLVVLHVMGNSARALLTDASGVKAVFGMDFPDLDVQDVLIANAGQVALVWLGPDQPAGLVYSVGDRFTTRLLTPALVVGVERDEQRLRLRLRDFSLPRVVIAIPDDVLRQQWFQRMEGGERDGHPRLTEGNDPGHPGLHRSDRVGADAEPLAAPPNVRDP